MRVRLLLSAVLLLAMTGAAFCEPKRVLLLHSFGRDFAPWNEYANSFRQELRRQSKEPVEIFETALATARFLDEQEGPFIDYLNALFSNRALDLIVAVGGPAANFVQRHRQKLFPSSPALYMGLEERTVQRRKLTANDAVVAIKIDWDRSIENILRVLPETTNVVVVLGDSPNEKYWIQQLIATFQPYQPRIAFTWVNELSFEETLKRVASLPSGTAILFVLMLVDAAGVVHDDGRVMARLYAAANAPIFSYNDISFGKGIVGGPLAIVGDVSRQAARVAVRIFGGEMPGGIDIPTVEFAAPRFDWRELQRWNISESRLPEGSEVYFRVPGLWEQYRPHLTAGLAALLTQAAIISWLLVERRRRILSQIEADNRRREAIRLNRVTTASMLSSSIAHELSQPLGAILSNTEAAQVLIKAHPPDLRQIDEILSNIVRDEQRANEIIFGLQRLLNNRTEAELITFDLNATVGDVVKIIAPEVERRAVVLCIDLAPEVLSVRCDPIHLQQVMINLVINGMDAMDGEPRPHNLTIKTRQDPESRTVEVAISDSGKGIPKDKLTSIFEAFVTTKPKGTGLGLPIARTILRSYGGDVWVENRQRGAAFFFRLPFARAGAG